MSMFEYLRIPVSSQKLDWAYTFAPTVYILFVHCYVLLLLRRTAGTKV